VPTRQAVHSQILPQAPILLLLKTAAGCLGSTQVTLTATSPCTSTTIVLTAAIVNTTPCVTPTNNGSITVTATGSTGFTYNINGGAYQASNVLPARMQVIM